MNSWQSGFVEENGVRIHFTRTAGDKPPFVLAHGFTDDGLCWTPVAERLSGDFDVIMPDARAHGLSSAPGQGYDAISQAEDLFGIIRALKLNRPFVLGHSMGAVTALALAAIHPNLPQAILLEDPPPWWNVTKKEATGDANQDNSLKNWALQLGSHTREELIASERLNHPNWSDGELEPWANSKLLFNPVMVNSFFIGRNVNDFDWEKMLGQVTCPALVLTGDPQCGSILKPEDVAVLKRMIPQLQSTHIASAGHSIRRDQFDRYMGAVNGFIHPITA
jgi:pimeloyl-ACP methyl ester carboxylesterase